MAESNSMFLSTEMEEGEAPIRAVMEEAEDASFQNSALFNPGIEQATSSTLLEAEENVLVNVGQFIAGAALAGIDSLAGGVLPGVDKNDVVDLALGQFPETLNKFRRNEDSLRLAGDIAVSFIPGLAAVKLIQGGSRLAQFAGRLKNTDSLRRHLFTSTALQANQQKVKLQIIDRLSAGAGNVGRQAFVSKQVARITREFTRGRVIDAAKEGVAFELGVLATLNDSDVLYSDDISTVGHLSFAVLGVVLPAGVAQIIARNVVNQSKRAATGIANGILDPAQIRSVANANFTNNTDLALRGNAIDAAANRIAVTMPASTPEFTANKITNLNSMFLANQKQGKELLEATMKQKVEGIRILQTGASTQQTIQIARQALSNDPNALAGVRTMFPGRNVGEVIEQKAAEALKRRAVLDDEIDILGDIRLNPESTVTDINRQIKKIDRINEDLKEFDQLQVSIVSSGGDRMPGSIYPKSGLFADNPDAVKFGKTSSGLTGEIQTAKFTDLTQQRNPVELTIDQQLNMTGPKLAVMSPKTASVMFAHMQKFAESYVVKGKVTTVLTDKSSFLQWRLAQQIVEKNPEAIVDFQITAKIGKFDPNNLAEGIEFGKLQKQFEEYENLLNKASKIRSESVVDRNLLGLSPQMIAYRLDMPGAHMSTSVKQQTSVSHPLFGEGQSGLEQLYLSLIMQGEKHFPDTLKAGGLSGIRQLAANTIELVDLGLPVIRNTDSSVNIPLTGISVNKADIPSIVIVNRNIAKEQLTRRAIIEEAAGRQAEIFESFAKADTPLMKQMAEIITFPSFAAAKNIEEVSEASRFGVAVATSQRFSFRNSIVFQALNNINTHFSKLTSEHITRVFDQPLLSAKTKITKRQAISSALSDLGSQVEFGLFAAAHENAFYKGLEPVLSKEDGLWRYPLIGSKGDKQQFEFNQTRWREVFKGTANEEMPENAVLSYLKDGVVTPVAMREKAHNAIMAFADITREVGLEKAALRKIRTGGSFQLRNLHLPPVNLAGQEVGFIFDALGTVRDTIRARSAEALDIEVASSKVQKTLADNQGWQFMKQKDVERFADLDDNVTFQLRDAGSLLGPKQATGAIGSDVIAKQGAATMKEMITSLEKQFQAVSKQSLALAFEPELSRMRVLDDAIGVADSGKSIGRRFIDQSVFKAYSDTLLGNEVSSTKGWVRDFNGTIETIYDGAFEKIRNIMGSNTIIDLLKKQTPLSAREAKQVDDALGNYNPYSSTIDFVEEQLGHRTPLTLKKNGAQFNGITTTLLLRFMEFSQALINVTGSVVNAPAIANALKPLRGENIVNYNSRMAPYGITFKTIESAQEAFATLSPVKSMVNVIRYARTKQGVADTAEAARRGMLQQQAAETNKVFSLSHDNFVKSILQTGMDMSTYISDKSEEMSRLYLHLMGLQIGRGAGLTNKNALHTFANNVANQGIGDYRSYNRPGIFQGAAGTPVGLFQTFALNYSQRMFGYIENKQTKSLAVQAFMQGSIFGGNSIPGVAQLNQVIASANDEKTSFSEAIDKATGSTVFSDVILNGGLANLPRLLGSGDSVSIYSRGDANIRKLPSLLAPTDLPQLNVARNIMQGLSAAVDRFREGGQFSVQTIAEIIGTYSPSRPVARVFELIAGVSLDKQQELISNDVLTPLSIGARLMGLRPGAERELIAARFENRQQDALQREIKSRIRDAIAPMLRGGTLDGDALTTSLYDYLNAGGQPENFGALIEGIIISAVTPKSQLEISKYLRGKQFEQAARLFSILQGVQGSDQ